MAKRKEPEYNDELRKKHQFLSGVHLYTHEDCEDILKSELPLSYTITEEDPVPLRRLGKIGDTTLHFAARLSSGTIEFYLKYPYDITSKNSEGDTPLHLYLKRKGFSITDAWGLSLRGANCVLQAHVDKNVTANPANKDGLSHFHVACVLNHTEAVKLFLESGVSPNLPVDGLTPLQLAMKCSCYETAKILLDHDADVNLKDRDGHTLIQRIQTRNRLIVERENFDDYQDELSANTRFAPLVTESDLFKFHLACLADDKDAVVRLLKLNTFNVDDADEAGYTGLHWAMHAKYDFSDTTVIGLLLKHKANVLKKNRKNLTPLDIFTRKCHSYNGSEILSLIEKETDLISFNSDKLREAFYSIFDNEKLEKLLNTKEVNGGTVCIYNESKIWPGFTLLHAAATLPKNNSKTHISNCKNVWEQPEYRSTVELLVENGADMTVLDADNQSPAHLAFYNNHDRTLKFMLSNYPTEIRTNPTDKNGLSHFHMACINRNCELVERFILSKTVNIDDPIHAGINEYKSGSTALHIAVVNGDKTMVSLLLKHGASVFSKNSDDWTPIHQSICLYVSREQDIVEALMSVPNIMDRNEVATSTGLSHFHVACRSKKRDLIETFLKQGENPFAPITGPNYFEGFTPIHFAVENGQWENVEILLTYSKEFFLSKTDGINLLHQVFRRVELLIWDFENGQSNFEKMKKIFELPMFEEKCLKFVNEMGMNQLHIACLFSNVSKIESLLLSGENPNAQIESNSQHWPGYTPLHMAAKFHTYNKESSCKVFRLLLEHGADITLENSSNKNPLEMNDYCGKDCTMLISTIVKFYFESDTVITKSPNQVFQLACRTNHHELVEKMLKIYQISFYWNIDTPLHIAAKHNSKEVVAILLKHGHEVDVQDVRVRTPLFYAVDDRKRDAADTINELLSYGAKVNTKSFCGKTPLYTCLDELVWDGTVPGENFSKTVKVLLNHGARIIESGQNLIERLVECSCVDLIRTIIVEAEDILELDNDGKSTMHYLFGLTYPRSSFRNVSIQKNDYVSLVHELLKRGGDLNCQDGKGNTPLHHAVDNDNEESVSALLTCGADLNLVNEEGKTALECAKEKCLRPLISNYIIGMNILKLWVSDQNHTCLASSAESDEKLIIEPKELEELKKISVNESITLYDVLVEMSVDEVSKIIPNEILESRLRNVDFYKEFPKLAGFLNLKYYQAKLNLTASKN